MNKLGDILKKFTRKTVKDEINKSYDIRKIFEDMELNLISSMKRAFYFHQAYQSREGFEWEQWQLSKLRELEKYRRENRKIISFYSKPIQKAIDRELQGNYARGQNRVVNLLNKFKQLFGIDNIAESNILIPEDIEKSQIEREYIAKYLIDLNHHHKKKVSLALMIRN